MFLYREVICSISQILSFHLYELTRGEHLFDYEKLAGQAFIKGNRVKKYEWTATGIKLTIPNIKKDVDLGKYGGEVATQKEYKEEVMEIQDIFGQSFICLYPTFRIL